MRKIKVHLKNRSYDILIGNKVLKNLGRILRDLPSNKRAVIITYRPIKSHFANTVKASMEKEGFSVLCLNIPKGEKSKSLSMVEWIYHKLFLVVYRMNL